jgi:hypothetical protein
MRKVPSAAGVARALRGVKKELKACLRQIHQQAAKMISKGNYAGSQTLVNAAQAVRGFTVEVEGFSVKWRSLGGSVAGPSASGERTPLWGYYEVILQALSSANGRVSTADLISRLEPIIGKTLKSSDLEPMSDGLPRWQRMVKRARKHMLKEGFIEAGRGADWRITATGRRAALGQPAAK